MPNHSFMHSVNQRFKILLAVSAVMMGTIVPDMPVNAQSSVQSNSDALQDALRRIARNSNDSSALADAGLAALEMGDMRAAIGFLAKADQIYGTSGRVKAGLGRALLAEQNPFGAIRYFDQAVANGIPVREIAADRGLAYDLIGRNREAQIDYELAMGHGRDDQLISRYAISLGISGDLDQADAQLNPLLQKSDRDAWRNRAFIFAMNGKKKDAENIVEQTMERRMAKAIKPFFDRMPKLTAAQKAAAVHFGHFPASENIGVDVAAVQLASRSMIRGGSGADAGLIPVGPALGADVEQPRILAMPDKSPRRRPGGNIGKKPDRKSDWRQTTKQVVGVERAESAALSLSAQSSPISAAPAGARPLATVSQAEASPSAKAETPGFETALGVGESPALVSQMVQRKVEIAGHRPGSPAVSTAAGASVPSAVQATAQAVDKPEVRDTIGKGPVNLVDFDLSQAGGATTDTAAATPASKPLADIIRGIAIPDKETRTDVVPVDLDEIEPAKPEPKIAPKPAEKAPIKVKEPEHPKRFWVQIATGSDPAALKYDYRRMARKHGELFQGNRGWTSPWGKTRRLVVGPFDDFKAAKAFESAFRKGGGDGFAWASAKGVEVNELTK